MVNSVVILHEDVALEDCLGKENLESFEESLDKFRVALRLLDLSILVRLDESFEKNFELQILEQKSLD